MHSLRLAGVPPIPPSFKRHRFDSDPSRFSLNLSLSKPIPTPFWAPLPSPPMSGSPPPEHPLESSQIAGRRRKRSDTPTTHAPSPVSTPAQPPASIFSEAFEEGHGEVVATSGISTQPATWPTSYPAPQTSHVVGAGPPLLPSPAPPGFHPQFRPSPRSPKSSRKSQVHVPAACVNCRSKHLRCDNSRPCHRCVQTGKEVSCHLL
jgi:Fungal Zn(2)-Cys(6) binuclear cluster domain